MPDDKTNWQEWAVTRDDKNALGKRLVELCNTFGLGKIKSQHNEDNETHSIKHKLGICFKNWLSGDVSKTFQYKDGRVDIGISREEIK